FEKIRDGYRYENMPHDGEAFRLGLQAIEEMAHAQHGASFTELGLAEQEQLLRALHDGKPSAGEAIWKQMSVEHFWMLLVKECAEAYYAHPWAWDEIGFGGPAYPRAYMRLEHGEPEPWEVRERRYEWEAPAWSQSTGYEAIGGLEEQKAPPGQGGTH
ncbi:MAG TPA: gluconate 2-dehydrogenase subunit 3 family protein, partial [Candidatus Lustribacter sp.]